MRAHRGHRDLLGQLEELAARTSRARVRATRRGPPAWRRDPRGPRSGRRTSPARARAASRIAIAPRLGVRLDVRVTELREVVVRPGHRGARPRRARGAPPCGRVADDAEELERNDLARRRARRRRAPGARRLRAPSPQRIVFGNVRPATIRGTDLREDLGASRPGIVFRAATVLPRGESTTTRSATSTFCARAKPSAAFVGLPSLSKALDAGGPRTSAARSAWLLGKPADDRARGGGALRTTRSLRREALFRERLAESRERAPAAPAAAPAPGSPPSGSRIRSPGRSCSLVITARAKPHVRKTLRSRRARRAPSQTVAGSGSDFGDRCPSFPET